MFGETLCQCLTEKDKSGFALLISYSSIAKMMNLEELRRALEDGNSSVYNDASLKKVSAKWKKIYFIKIKAHLHRFPIFPFAFFLR